MEIDERKITIKELYDGYCDDAEEGVTGFEDNLDIRPKYQREFVYDDAKRNEVIHTVMKELPLNIMYWVDRGEEFEESDEPRYEVMDGQQRTISICRYLAGDFSVDGKYFANLPGDIKKKFEDYRLFIYVCSGTESEKLDWFRIINIAGEPLTEQELRNAVYAGPWVSDAKRHFSKSNCAAYQLAKEYLKGSPIRQEYLETAIEWMAEKDGVGSVEEYMAIHQHNQNAMAIWREFRDIIEWVKDIFPVLRKEMKGLDWGHFYIKNKDRTDLNAKKLEEEIQRLMADEDVTRKSGVYEYLLTGEERCLSIRAFTDRDRRAAYERQKHKCAMCGKTFDIKDMHADHIKPWSKGGTTTAENCQMLCRDCNLKKSDK